MSRQITWPAVPAVILASMIACTNAGPKPVADLLITNAKVWTADEVKPRAEAVAVIGDRIVAVGSSAEIEAWRGAQTHVIDAGGKLLLPGFNDAHVHFIDGGRQLDNVDLKDAPTPQEFARATLDGKNPNGWIPEQKITVEEAVAAYTIGSAYAEFQEKEKGSITRGKLADMVILDTDIFNIATAEIRNVKVRTTILGGKVIYSAAH